MIFRHRFSIGYCLAGICILLICAIRCSQSAKTYQNLSPEISYTGIQSCQPCHKKIYDSFIQTGMGKSLYPPDPTQIIEAFGPNVNVYDPKEDFYYHPFWANDQLFIREYRLADEDTVFERTELVDYIVGSGHQTRSYLMQRNGYLYEFPITWYVNKKIWDLSPGYETSNTRFDREIGTECLSCHTGHIEQVKGTKNKYRKISMGIDCEKCHGPGSVHIKAIEGGQLIDVGEEIDYTIVNPAKLSVQQQFDVCQQCHLQGINVPKEGKSPQDYRPSMLISQTHEVFLEQQKDTNAFGIASHAERLQQSRCFIGSSGQLTCTTCHDPHKSINTTSIDQYVSQCTNCHQDGHEPLCSVSSELQLMEEGNCVSCHMPKGGTSDIPHVSFHDHKIRILRSNNDTASLEDTKAFLQLKSITSDNPDSDLIGQAWLLFFERQDPAPNHLDKADQLLNSQNHFAQAQLAYYKGNFSVASTYIEQAIAEQPDDPERHFLQGQIAEKSQQWKQAYDAYHKAFELNSQSVDAGIKMGVMLLRTREGDPKALTEAAVIFENLLDEKPFDVRLLTNLGFVKMNQGNLNSAESQFVQALSYNPDDDQALENMILVQLLKNNAALAQKYWTHFKNKYPNHANVIPLQKRILENQ